jgi:SAM-dependent methyltransferase
MKRVVVSLMVLSMSLLTATGFAQEAAKKHAPEEAAKKKGMEKHGHGHGSAADLNRQFLAPDLDVSKFVKRFEGSDREIAVHREAIGRLAALRPGAAVADIGAGTGLFTWTFAKEVGDAGKVYAVEVSPGFLKYLADEAKKKGVEKTVAVVAGGAESPNLDAGSIDVAFVCATYHHFEKPAAMLAAIHAALRPGGRLVIVDWDLRGDASDYVKDRARGPRAESVAEITRAGFVEEALPEGFPALKDNFAAVFRRVDRPAQAP